MGEIGLKKGEKNDSQTFFFDLMNKKLVFNQNDINKYKELLNRKENISELTKLYFT